MAKIPQDIIERVRDTADIVDVVSQFVDLRQRGPNFLVFVLFIARKQLLLVLHLPNRSIIVLVVIREGMYSHL